MTTEQETKDISVIYADFIGFNKLAKIFQPDDMMAFLNKLFTVMEKPIEDNEGIIDKIVGDGIIITFNAFSPLANHQESAVKTALGIIKAVRQFAHEEEQSIELGIGIASGDACCGPLGTSKFRPKTVVGTLVGRAIQLSMRSCNEKTTTLLVDAQIFHETISSFEYQQLEEDVFKINIPLL